MYPESKEAFRNRSVRQVNFKFYLSQSMNIDIIFKGISLWTHTTNTREFLHNDKSRTGITISTGALPYFEK